MKKYVDDFVEVVLFSSTWNRKLILLIGFTFWVLGKNQVIGVGDNLLTPTFYEYVFESKGSPVLLDTDQLLTFFLYKV